MLTKFVRLYTKSTFIILTLILFLPITKLSAHNPTKSPWLFLNEVPVTEDMENPIPNPSKLPWGEHAFSGNIAKGESIKVSIDRSVIERDLGVTVNDIQTSYKLTDPSNADSSFSEDFTKVLDTTGNYFLDIVLTKKNTTTEIISESVMIVVGDKETAPEFKVNNESVDIESTAPTFTVSDNYDLKFEVTNPGDFNYTWDLGTGETKDGTSINYSFDKAKIPVYVVLRKQNKVSKVFSDSYVRIDSDRANGFGVPRPPVKIPEVTIGDNEGNLGVKLVFGGFIVILLSIVTIVILRKRK